VYLQGCDVWKPDGQTVTVAQGFASGKHLLRLVPQSQTRPQISAVRVYRPVTPDAAAQA